MGFNYMLPCFFVDIAYNSIQNKKYGNLIFAVPAGIGYMLIPLSRIITNVLTGYPYGSFLKYGFVTPLATFLLFGLMGGILGTGFYSIGKKLFNNG